jgi:hypothetical protein
MTTSPPPGGGPPGSGGPSDQELFAALRLEARCKVCALTQGHPDEGEIAQKRIDLFLELHRKFILDGWPHTRLSAWLTGQCSVLNETLPPAEQLAFVSESNVRTHFTKHLSAEFTALARTRFGRLTLVRDAPRDPVQSPLKEMVQQAHTENLEDFGRLHRLSLTIEERFYNLDKAFAENGVTIDNCVPYGMFARSVATMIEACVKMRNQDQVVKAAMISVMDLFTIGALKMLIQGVDSLLEEYRPHFKNPDVAAQFAHQVRKLITVSMTEAARTAIDQAREKMKIA